MAIPATPSNLNVQQANRQVYLSWGITAGALSYSVQVSTDGVNYTVLATPTINNYLDTTVVVGTQYFYQVASVNVSGTSPYTDPQTAIPAPTSEMSLGQLRLMSQQKSDRVNSNFVTLPEWNSFINLAMYELYDLLVTVDEEYFVAIPVQFVTTGVQFQYPLPDGALTFTNGITQASTFVAPAFYKLKGVDIGLNSATNAFGTLSKFNFIDRNRWVYPNNASLGYGPFNGQYRLIGNNIQFIPPPTGNQPIRIWYIPRLTELLQDTDITTLGYSGWLNYVIVRAAKYALDKEESDSSKLDVELAYLKDRIESTAVNRDMGMPDTVSDIRSSGLSTKNWGGGGASGPMGGF